MRAVPLALVAVAAAAVGGCGGSGSGGDEVNAPTLPEKASAPVLELRLEGWEKTDFRKRSVPLDEFLSGGPPKDGIPAIDAPRFAPVREIEFLEPREPVMACR